MAYHRDRPRYTCYLAPGYIDRPGYVLFIVPNTMSYAKWTLFGGVGWGGGGAFIFGRFRA